MRNIGKYARSLILISVALLAMPAVVYSAAGDSKARPQINFSNQETPLGAVTVPDSYEVLVGNNRGVVNQLGLAMPEGTLLKGGDIVIRQNPMDYFTGAAYRTEAYKTGEKGPNYTDPKVYFIAIFPDETTFTGDEYARFLEDFYGFKKDVFNELWGLYPDLKEAYLKETSGTLTKLAHKVVNWFTQRKTRTETALLDKDLDETGTENVSERQLAEARDARALPWKPGTESEIETSEIVVFRGPDAPTKEPGPGDVAELPPEPGPVNPGPVVGPGSGDPGSVVEPGPGGPGPVVGPDPGSTPEPGPGVGPGPSLAGGISQPTPELHGLPFPGGEGETYASGQGGIGSLDPPGPSQEAEIPREFEKIARGPRELFSGGCPACYCNTGYTIYGADEVGLIDAAQDIELTSEGCPVYCPQDWPGHPECHKKKVEKKDIALMDPPEEPEVVPPPPTPPPGGESGECEGAGCPPPPVSTPVPIDGKPTTRCKEGGADCVATTQPPGGSITTTTPVTGGITRATPVTIDGPVTGSSVGTSVPIGSSTAGTSPTTSVPTVGTALSGNDVTGIVLFSARDGDVTTPAISGATTAFDAAQAPLLSPQAGDITTSMSTLSPQMGDITSQTSMGLDVANTPAVFSTQNDLGMTGMDIMDNDFFYPNINQETLVQYPGRTDSTSVLQKVLTGSDGSGNAGAPTNSLRRNIDLNVPIKPAP
ncbi:hypothetical protein ACFLRA_01080 [Bdellovibrionota bacterium]